MGIVLKRFCSLGAIVAIFALTGSSARAEITDRHRQVVDEVFNKLLAVMETPVHWEVWPPTVTILDEDFTNAFAGYNTVDGKDVPYVEITTQTIEEIAQFDPEVLAFTLGHELGHLAHDHGHQHVAFSDKFGSKLPTVRLACQREHELEADLYGMQLAFKAGYSHRGMMADLKGWRGDETPYCRFEGLGLTHPTWEDRAAHLLQDDSQRALWQSLSSFQTGVMFLQNQHFLHAELCFHNVTVEFPECYEAWANLGYARLMRYCDALDVEDLRLLDVGHLVVGGFYQRPDSLEADVRGADEDLWFEAVGALREALRLRERLGLEDQLLMVKANLAVAYLVSPGGKDIGQAERLFNEVFAGLKDPTQAKRVDPLVHASILINSGLARGFDSELVDETLKLLARAKTVRGNSEAVASMEAALSYNQARTLSNTAEVETQTSALKMLEKYLEGVPASSSWWPMAYDQYAKLAKGLKVEARPSSDFRQPGIRDWRPVTAVVLSDGRSIGLSDSLENVLKLLGPAEMEIPVIEGTNLKFYKYPQLGISVLATREVLAVVLESQSAPSLTLRRPGLGGDEVQVSLGMPRAELEALLGSDWDVELTQLFDVEQLHQLYKEVGLAAQFKDGQVSELVVSVVPLKSSQK